MRTQRTLIAIVLLVAVTMLFVVGSIAAGPPSQDPGTAGGISLAGTVASKISYQGRLTDAGGNPLDGSYNLVFQLWDDATAGSQVGSDIVRNNVPVSNGLFTVELDVPQDAFNGQGLWLQVSVSGQTLSPRQELLPVPYALSLKPGAHVEGDSSDTVLSATNSGSGDGIRGSTSSSSGHGVYGEATNSGDVRNYGGFFVAEGSQGRGVYGKAANPADEINYGGFFYASGIQGRGVFGQAAGSSGIGVKGWASDEGDAENYGGYFTASGARGIGIYAEAPFRGIYSKGTGVDALGVLSEVSGEYAMAVYGTAWGRAGVGVLGKAKGTVGQGVRGYADATDNVTNYGGYFEARGGSGRGVYGQSTGSDGIGVYGYTTGGQGIGVYGHTLGTWGLYTPDSLYVGDEISVSGDVEVQGGLTVDGPATGFFPSPAYDSGYRSVNQGQDITLVHNLGGNPDNYVVDIHCKYPPTGGTILGIGVDFNDSANHGFYWESLTSNSILVARGSNDTFCPQIRVRIWVYK